MSVRTTAQRIIAVITVTPLLGALAATAGPAPAALAATGTVTVNRVPSVTVNYGSSAVIKPHVAAYGNVTVTSRTLTVKRGTRTLAYRKASARLRAGTYAVTTRATYRRYTVSTSYQQKAQQQLGAAAWVDTPVTCQILSGGGDYSNGAPVSGECTGNFDGAYPFNGTVYDSYPLGTYTLISNAGDVNVTDITAPQPVGAVFDTTLTPTTDLYKTVMVTVPVYTRHYGTTRVKSLAQTLVIHSRPKPRGCAYYSDFQKVNYDFSHPEWYGDSVAIVAQKLQSAGTISTFDDSGDQVIVFRDYKSCSGGSISVGFDNGHAYTKHYMSY